MSIEPLGVRDDPQQPKPSDEQHSLDPSDWDEFRALAHSLLDGVLTHVRTIRDRPVWQAAPPVTREHFASSLPSKGRELGGVLDDVKTHVLPFATGNLHPRFMGWVNGAGTPVGILAEIVSAGLNMNCGGRNHIGVEIERQITRWMAEVFSYPETASGLFVTGSSMANFLATIIAKTHAIGCETRRLGVWNSEHRLVGYTSIEAHGCVAQAFELSGLGSNALRRVPVDASGRMDIAALRTSIREDMAAGALPFMIIASAGTVNTGAVDSLAEIAEIAARENLWFHVDGAIGAIAALSPRLRPLLSGIEASDSIALDFHKWGHVPYDAGFLLVRDRGIHKSAFVNSAAYLQSAERGLAAGDTWPCDLGLDLSRGCRALKTWMTLEALGASQLAEAAEFNCHLARYLAGKIERGTLFELKAPVTLSIVCFGMRGEDMGKVNRDLVIGVQVAGSAVPSWTTLNGEIVIRCAIINHRTTRADIDAVYDALSAEVVLRGITCRG
jgi:aromatic-L-amino-acid decarboxylase